MPGLRWPSSRPAPPADPLELGDGAGAFHAPSGFTKVALAEVGIAGTRVRRASNRLRSEMSDDAHPESSPGEQVSEHPHRDRSTPAVDGLSQALGPTSEVVATRFPRAPESRSESAIRCRCVSALSVFVSLSPAALSSF